MSHQKISLPALRSMLFIPGNRPAWLTKADSTGADAVVVDLEDAVPQEQKAQARDELRAILEGPDRPALPVFVRVNALDDELFLRDIEAIGASRIVGIILPKVTAPKDIQVAERVLSWFEDPANPLCIFPVLETAPAIQSAFEIAAASPRVAYMGGISSRGGDVERAIGYRWSPTGTETLALRSRVLLDARAANVHNPLSGLWSDVRDLEGLRRFANDSRDLGYEGLTIIHPSHAAIVNEVFTPTDAELDRDERLVHAMAAGTVQGRGAVTFEGHMIDEAMSATSRQRLEKFRPNWSRTQ